MDKFRKDDLIGIRKARFASFVLLFVCFAAMLVIFILLPEGGTEVYLAFVIVLAVLLTLWWFIYRNILYGEAAFFEALTSDMRSVHSRLRILEATVRGIPDGVVILAENGDLIFVNETAKNLLAAFDDDLDDARYDEYAAGFSKGLERAAILEATEKGSPPETVCVNGQHYKIGYVAFVQEKNKERGAVAVISDVTENTKVENMQIEFVANVSHELKTPLAVIKSYTETLMGVSEDAETLQKFMEMIVSEVDIMDRLIKDLLYLARVDFTGSDIKTSESDLPSLVRMSIKKLGLEANKKSLSLNQMFADDLRISMEMDRDRIEQVILNILGNAIKYTEEKGRVDVDIISGQNCVQIVITDNGIGIPEEDLSRVFERFFRVDKARTEKSGGTGLGLAISKQIVDAHNGTINLESKYGRGTTVTISLPSGKMRSASGTL